MKIATAYSASPRFYRCKGQCVTEGHVTKSYVIELRYETHGG